MIDSAVKRLVAYGLETGLMPRPKTVIDTFKAQYDCHIISAFVIKKTPFPSSYK